MIKLVGGLFTLAGTSLFFLFFSPKTMVLQNQQPGVLAQNVNLPAVPEAPAPSSSPVKTPSTNGDISNQPQLPNPPEVVKALYLTGWTAGSYNRVTSIINLIEVRGLNAVVIDIKDYSGYVSYAMDVPGVKASGADGEVKIAKPNELIKRLHDKNIYVIGRVTVFQDPILAKAHPEWALHNASSGSVWLDNHKLAWMDPDGQPTWDYVISIAKDGLSRGFDEINFDYIRFASDGNLGAISFPFWDKKTAKHLVIKKFFGYLREQMPDAKLSADLFGLSTYDSWDDLGIGQVIEDAYQYFDYVCPMVYPSHYAAGTLNFKNPADHPYEIIKYSMDRALERLLGKTTNGTSTVKNVSSTSTSTVQSAQPVNYRAKLRPWIQVFDLGAIYTPAMIQEEIKASDDALAGSDKYGGWLMWDPANIYKNFK